MPIKLLVAVLAAILPQPLRRAVYRGLLGYSVSPGARVGLSLVLVDKAELGAGARIGHFNVIRNLDELVLAEGALIGNFNWISGYRKGAREYFGDAPERVSALAMGRDSSVTHRHLLDCTDRIVIGRFSTVGGWRTQILTHAIDFHTCRQVAAPVTIGEYCFVGTGAILLKGSALPDRSVLAAGAVLASRLTEQDSLYGGVPARRLGGVGADAAFFTRSEGVV